LTERRIVIPGELVTDQRKKLGAHVYVVEGKILSDCMGLVEEGVGLGGDMRFAASELSRLRGNPPPAENSPENPPAPTPDPATR